MKDFVKDLILLLFWRSMAPQGCRDCRCFHTVKLTCLCLPFGKWHFSYLDMCPLRVAFVASRQAHLRGVSQLGGREGGTEPDRLGAGSHHRAEEGAALSAIQLIAEVGRRRGGICYSLSTSHASTSSRSSGKGLAARSRSTATVTDDRTH